MQNADFINKAIRTNPSNINYYFSLAQVYRTLNNANELIACYQKLLVHVPDNADAYNSLGNAFKGQNRFDEAITSYQKALALNPDLAESLGLAGSPAWKEFAEIRERKNRF